MCVGPTPPPVSRHVRFARTRRPLPPLACGSQGSRSVSAACLSRSPGCPMTWRRVWQQGPPQRWQPAVHDTMGVLKRTKKGFLIRDVFLHPAPSGAGDAKHISNHDFRRRCVRVNAMLPCRQTSQCVQQFQYFTVFVWKKTHVKRDYLI